MKIIKSNIQHSKSNIHLYPYHNKIKSRIANNELIKYEYLERYKNIAPCLLLYFNTEPFFRPIREHRFEEYESLLDASKDITIR